MSKNKSSLFALITSIFISIPTFAEPLSLGFELGSFTGLSLKYSLGNDRAIGGGLSYSYYSDYGSTLYVDYLVDRARTIDAGKLDSLYFYYGGGLIVSNIRRGRYEGRSDVGVRVPFGISKSINNPDLDLFAALVPVLLFASSTDVYIGASVGLRFRF